ncbi:hypothetical protein F2Q70_00022815 [Brassica cretica]|uniref:DUF223 domain-containing protein n=1 Tax=Brassica cretica TaxID=69181 RepID=A0A8S9GT16_BRACR|nr:hypothetical protein F2Q70_00022815 [Brassica cretica]
MAFKDVKYGPHDGELRFRLIHFWEARNVVTKVLIGLEMLLIDQEETVIQGYIPAGRIDTYLPHMRAGGIYRLNSFFGSNNKTLYRVAEPSFTITFSSTSVLSDLEDSSVCFPEDRFRFHGYEEFDAACNLRGDLYDFVNGQILSDSLVLDDAEKASSRRVLLHVQTHDGPVMKLYLWDKAASDFSEKFKASGGTARVILVTTVNPKRFGAISSMTPSRVFLDTDVQETRDYLTWMNKNLAVANRVDGDIVTKTETVTIDELFSYMKQEDAKVVQYQLAVVGATLRQPKGLPALCVRNVGKPILLVLHSTWPRSQCMIMMIKCLLCSLVVLDMSYLELVENYFEANENVGDDHLVPVPQALIDTIGQTRKFIVKVPNHNLTDKTQALTVTKVFTPEVPKVEANLEGNVAVPDAQETLHREERK